MHSWLVLVPFFFFWAGFFSSLLCWTMNFCPCADLISFNLRFIQRASFGDDEPDELDESAMDAQVHR